MSLIPDWQSAELSEFPGPNLLVDEEDARSALLALNTEYLPGQMRTRAGFTGAFGSILEGGPVTTMYNWLQSLFNRLLTLESRSTVFTIDLNSPFVKATVVPAITAEGMVCAPAGSRIYMAFFKANGLGATETRIWDGLFDNAVPRVEKAFTCPPTAAEFTVVVTEPVAGVVSKGVHKFGFVFTTKNGHQLRPAPNAGSVGLTGFQPVSFTAAGAKQLVLTLTPVFATGQWPAYLDKVAPIMTTVQNPNRYFFVPGAEVTVPANSPLTVPITINIDDVTLASTGTDATPWFSIACQTDLGAQFFPHFVFEYSNRMGYIVDVFDSAVVNTISEIFFSEPYNYQFITSDQHRVRLPGARRCVAAFVLGNVAYLVGPNWTYAMSDNTLTPVEWVPPQLIDGSIGTLSPKGVTVNAAKGIAWICDQAGLYWFAGGAYPRLPISYNQTPDWQRINWAASAAAVQVVDESTRKRVRVMAPLDGATSPTHIMTWDYTEGLENAKYSLDSIAASVFAPGPGAIEVVLNQTSKELELWVSRAATGKILRQKHEPTDAVATLYNDDTAAIDNKYKTPAIPAVFHAPVQHHGGHFRVRGSGSIPLTAFSYDQTRSRAMAPITASAAPGRDYLRFLDMQSEAVRYLVTNGNVADAYFILSRIVGYFSPWMTQRVA